MLSDYLKQAYFTAKKWKHVQLVTLEVTIAASGVPTLVTANSSPNVSITQTGTGTYDVVIPKHERLVSFHGSIQVPSLTAAAGQYASISTANPLTGAYSINTVGGTTGLAANPANGTTLRLRFEVSRL